MGVCLSKKEQLHCNGPVMDRAEKSTLLRDGMSSPACQLRRFSLDTPRFSAEISEMVAVLFHKAAARSSGAYCGCSSEKFLSSSEMRRCCSSTGKLHRRSLSFSSRLCCELMKSEAPRERISCGESRINACVSECCIAIGRDDVSITYRMAGDYSSSSDSSCKRKNSPTKDQDASSPLDGSDDETAMPGPTNSPERGWVPVPAPASPSLRQNATQKQQSRCIANTSSDLIATSETLTCAASHSSWEASAGDEFYPHCDVGIAETSTENGAGSCRNPLAALDEIAVFNAEDYFREDTDYMDKNQNTICIRSSNHAVATSAASACADISPSPLFACVSNAGMLASSCEDDCYCPACPPKPNAAEETSLLGSNRSTLSASKNSEASAQSSRRKLSKTQRCRQLIESIKLLATDAHHCFSDKHSDSSAPTKPSSSSYLSPTCSHGGLISSSNPSMDRKIKPGKESLHRRCTERLYAPFGFCKVAAGSRCVKEADAYSKDQNASTFSAQPKQCFPSAPSLLDALPAFGSPLTVMIRTPADPAPIGKHEPAGNVNPCSVSPHQPNFVSRSSSPDDEDAGEYTDSGSDLFEIDSLTPYLDVDAPDTHQTKDPSPVCNALPKFMATNFSFHSTNTIPSMESTTKASAHHQVDLHCTLPPEFIQNS